MARVAARGHPDVGSRLDQLLALAPRLLGLTIASPRAPTIIAWAPVFVGALTAALASLTAARLEPAPERRAPVALSALVFAAALPTSVHITQVGAVDHHMIESLAPLLALLWVAARRAWSPLRWELAGGGLLASMTYLFSGTMATHALVAAALALSLLVEARPLPRGSRSGSAAERSHTPRGPRCSRSSRSRGCARTGSGFITSSSRSCSRSCSPRRARCSPPPRTQPRRSSAPRSRSGRRDARGPPRGAWRRP